MGHSVAHLVGERQRQIWMLCCEIGIVLLYIVAGLADDLEISDYGVLNQVVFQKVGFG